MSEVNEVNVSVDTLELDVMDDSNYTIEFVNEPERPLGFKCDALPLRSIAANIDMEFGYRIQTEECDQVGDVSESLEALLTKDVPDGCIIMRLFFGSYDIVAKRINGKWMMSDLAECSVIGRFEYDDQIPSVNAEYIPVRRGRGVQKTLSTYGRKFKEITADQVQHTEIDGWLERIRPYMKTRIRLKVEFVQILADQFNRRDTSNMVKLAEDAICDHIGINDSWNYEVSSKKYSHDLVGERMFVKLSAVNVDAW